ncbi:MAG: hypothetical protein ACOYYS_26090 [Chloroflexota bacterium]
MVGATINPSQFHSPTGRKSTRSSITTMPASFERKGRTCPARQQQIAPPFRRSNLDAVDDMFEERVDRSGKHLPTGQHANGQAIPPAGSHAFILS